MSKKGVIIGTVVIVLLVCGISALSLINGHKERQPLTASEEMVYTILSEAADDIADIEVVPAQGETLRTVNLGSAIWTVNDMSTDEIDTSKAYSLAGMYSNLTSKNKIEENPSDLSQYGLDNPNYTVTLTMKSGEKHTIFVGDLSPTLGEYFVMKDGDNMVYTIYSYKVDALAEPISYYREFNRFNINVNDIYCIKMIRSGEIVILKIADDMDKNSGSAWEMTSPYTSRANDDYIDGKILEPIEKLQLSTPVDEDGGFTSTSPMLILTITPYNQSTGDYGESRTETLTLGKSENGNTYVKFKNDVFLVPTEDVSFINESAFNLVSKLQALVDITTVSQLVVEYGGESHTIGITNKDYEFSFTLDGADADASASQQMYQDIISLNVDAPYEGEDFGETVLKLTYKSKNRTEPDTVVEFRKINSLNCALIRDGKADFIIRTNKLTELCEEFDEYAENTER